MWILPIIKAFENVIFSSLRVRNLLFADKPLSAERCSPPVILVRGPFETCAFTKAWLTIALNTIEFDNQKVNLFTGNKTVNKMPN